MIPRTRSREQHTGDLRGRRPRRGALGRVAGTLGATVLALTGVTASLAVVAATATPAEAAAPVAPSPNWIEATSATGPDERNSAAMAYDDATGQLVLFGGIGGPNPYSPNFLGDTWTFDGTTWTPLSPATSPAARYGAAMGYDQATGQLILFGGQVTGTGRGGDTWDWNGTTWTPLSPATSPPAREGASMAYDQATGQLILFGGIANSELNDTWAWTGTTWTPLSPATSPPARGNAAMAYDPALGEIVLFGGQGYGPDLSDTWTWNGTTWTEASPTTSPSTRWGPAMAYDPATGQLVLVGGDYDGPYRDTWTYDGTTWTEQSPVSSPAPSAERSLAFDPATGQLVDFGGDISGTTWYWGFPSGLAGTWSTASTTGSPPGRSYSVMAYDAATGQTVMFGGNEAVGQNQADTWVYDGGTWTKQTPLHSPSGRAASQMAFDAATGQLILFGGNDGSGPEADTWDWTGTDWTHLTPATSPPARDGGAMAFDAETGQLVLYGGYSGVNLSDTWTWNGTTWYHQSPAHVPPARAYPAMAFDEATSQLVLFGGYGAAGDLADTWVWTGSDWSPQSPAASPPGREFPTLVFDPATGQLLCFGGQGASGELADTWAWTTTDGTGNWTPLSPSKSPSARDYALGAFDATDGQLVLFGGENTSSGSLADAWAYQLVATSPGTPEITSVTPEPGAAQLTFTAPTSDGGSPVTGYDVYEGSSPAHEGTTPVNTTLVPAGSTTTTVTGLTNGTPYFFELRAVNAAGKSGASNEAPVTPLAPPGAPANFQAFGDQDHTVQLNWTSPTDDGGAPVTGFDVFEGTSPGGESATPVNPSPLAADTVSFNATGLTNGTTYYFTVAAINDVGVGTPTAEMSAVPSTVPGPAVLTSAVAGDTTVTLHWTPPADDGGNAVNGYDVFDGPTATSIGSTPLNAAPLAADATSYEVTGLTDATSYAFAIVATNNDGWGAQSNALTATPASVPEPVANPKATSANGSATITWAAPSSNGGSPITGYDVFEGTRPGHESTTPLNSTPLGASKHIFVVTKLHNGTTYYFTVEAINEIGRSNPSTEVSATPATVPGAPASVGAAAGNDDVKVTWKPPGSTGGSAVTGYEVFEGTASGHESTTAVDSKPLAASARSLTVAKLKAGTKYYFVVRALNARGLGARSAQVAAVPVAAAGVRSLDAALIAAHGRTAWRSAG